METEKSLFPETHFTQEFKRFIAAYPSLLEFSAIKVALRKIQRGESIYEAFYLLRSEADKIRATSPELEDLIDQYFEIHGEVA